MREEQSGQVLLISWRMLELLGLVVMIEKKKKTKPNCNFFWTVLCPHRNENLTRSSTDYLLLFSLPSLTNISWREWAMDDFAKLEVNIASDFFFFLPNFRHA